MEQEIKLQVTEVYSGMMSHGDRHNPDCYYFAPTDWTRDIPFSRGFESHDLAEKAALAWEARFDLEKIGYGQLLKDQAAA